MLREASRPFDLTRGPLLRARLVRLAADDHVLIVVMHHIASDGWSTGVLLREIGALYGAFVAGHAVAVAGAAGAVCGLCGVAAGAGCRENGWSVKLDYWQERLSGAPAALDLPTDRPRPAVQSFRGGRVPLVLSAELTAKLQALARSRGRDAVHGAAGRLPGGAVALERSGRHRGGDADRRGGRGARSKG